MTETHKDPVCGMDVKRQAAAATQEFKGTTYYFCSPGCRRESERDPENYLHPRHEAHM